MKKIKNSFLMLAAMALFASSCGKEGAVGPQGSQSSQDTPDATGLVTEVGLAGPASADGAPGSVIYSGTTAPSASLGIIGDYYLNKSNDLLYGPKTASGWGTPISLKGSTGLKGPTGAHGATGAKGATGVRGNTVLTGLGIPDASTGVAGDYYLDKNTYLLYGPKTATGWGPAVSLVGPTGPAGAAGTANVEYSGWNYATNFRDTTIDNSAQKLADLAAPALTQTVLDGGLVQIYFNFGAGVFPLPYTSNAGGKANTMSYLPRLGHFVITRFTLDNSNSVPLSTILQYRYIIIPGGTALATAKARHLDFNNYDAVKTYFNIKD